MLVERISEEARVIGLKSLWPLTYVARFSTSSASRPCQVPRCGEIGISSVLQVHNCDETAVLLEIK